MAQCQKCVLLLQRFPAITLGSSQLPLTLAPGAPVFMCLCAHVHIQAQTETYSKIELGGVVHSKPDTQEAQVKGLPFEFEPKLGHIHNKTKH